MRIQNNYDLKTLNTFGIDAKANSFIQIESEVDLQFLSPHLKQDRLILGGGSNILLSKSTIEQAIKIDIKGIRIVKDEDKYVLVEVGAGENWHELVLWAIDNDLGGIENLSLIPGNVGAAPMQNIGAYGVELKDVFHSLWAYDLDNEALLCFHNNECQFGYRESIFKTNYKGKLIITKVILQLSKASHHILNMEYGAIQETLEEKSWKPTIQNISNAVIKIRSSKLPDPIELPNAGSFFKNPIVSKDLFQGIYADYPQMPFYPTTDDLKIKIPAGWLIEQCGWKGKVEGNVACYEKQALVIINKNGAGGDEILAFAKKIISSVKENFGIELIPEVNLIS